MKNSLRVVIGSAGTRGFKTLHTACIQAGHLPVAWIHSRSIKPGSEILPSAGRTVEEILEAIPPRMDLLLPGSPAGLAEALPGYRPDIIVVYGFAWKIPESVLRIPDLGALNIHPSLLPRHRGPMAIAWAIRNGEPHFGVTVHKMDADFDTGNIIASRGGIPLDEDPTPERLWRRVDPVIRDLLPDALDRVARGFMGNPQDYSKASYEGALEPEFYRIDWLDTAKDIHNQVRTFRSMAHEPGPIAQLGDRRIRVLRTRLKPGDGLRVECADGPLWIVESTVIQRDLHGKASIGHRWDSGAS